MTTRTPSSTSTRSTRTSRPPAAPEAPHHVGGITYQLKWILCGRQSCGRWHGPYWYAFWSDHGRTRCKYVGKKLPESIRSAPPGITGSNAPDR